MSSLPGLLQLPLVTPEPASYRLRKALIDITTRGGNRIETLDSDATQEEAAALELELAQGEYTADLRDGCRLERLDGEQATAVNAALLTPNPASFAIESGQVRDVVFTFTTDDGVIALGQGSVSIGIEVVSVAPLADCALYVGWCPGNLTCLLADQSGRTFCAQPGSLPVGSPCSGEQCQAGSQCLSLEPERPERRTCVRYCDTTASLWACNYISAGMAASPYVGVCAPLPANACDLLSSQCGEGMACQYLGGAWGVCGTPGERAEGEECSQPEECAAGLRCFHDQPGAQLGHCWRFCDTRDPLGSGCENGCWFVDGTGHVGVCAP